MAMVGRSAWFTRIVLAGATVLFVLIGMRSLVDPIGAAAPHQITLGSSDAVTIERVTGGLFLGIAAVMVACVSSARRLGVGAGVLAMISTAVLAARLAGLFLDGAGPFTIQVLKPEVALVLLSSAGYLVERRRQRTGGEQMPIAPVHPRVTRTGGSAVD